MLFLQNTTYYKHKKLDEFNISNNWCGTKLKVLN